MPKLPHSSETESIVGIQFGVFSPDEIARRSVVEITTHNTQEGKIGGLADPRMGVLENGKVCRSCGLNNHGCPGHFGHFKLARPVYYIQFYKMLLKILRCVCIKCGKLLIDKDTAKGLKRAKGENRWKVVLTACQDVTRCGEQTEDGCGARQPHRYHDEPICRIVAEWKGMANGTEESDTLRRFLEPEYVYRLLRRVSDEDVDFMGFSRLWCRPDWMMCTVLAIPPPQVRPSVLQDNNQRSEDDLTQKLIDIIKVNGQLNDKIMKGSKKTAIDDWWQLLQYHVATLVDNDIPGVAQSAQRSGRPLKSLQARLGTKEGRIRNNLQGKRVEFSARSVITPDPNISVKELGVPMKVAMNLTFPEIVTKFNCDRLYAMVQNGPDKYPGAKSVERAGGVRTISLKHVDTKKIQIYEGDTVHRHMLDGDPILFNRQPSLHRMSAMCHLAKVLPFNTFRLNVSVTKPYNADFDGDEMNAHMPQTVEAAMELLEIAAVPKQMISPRLSKPLISIVQDTLVGVNRLTRPTEFFTRREFMNLLIHSKRWDGTVPLPAKTDPVPLWSGQQVVSALLPAVYISMGNKVWDEANGKKDPNYVIINNGNIEQGILDGDVFDKALIHILYNDFNPDMTVDFIDSTQSVVATYLQNSGFSVGLSDLIADEGTLSAISSDMNTLKRQIESLQLQVHMGLFDNPSGRTNQEEFESRVFQTLNKAIDNAGNTGLKSLSTNNRMVNMVKCGSKGANLNIAQMIALLGQQSIEGKRIAYGFQDRTLPHFKRFDDGAEARGFIENSFVKGLNPYEFFFHAMTGREGLIDTAVKTADSGYMQRQLVKTMEDLMVFHDGSVRDAGGLLVQQLYGDDGTSATKIENQPIGLGKMSDSEISQKFVVNDVDGARSQAFIAQIMMDRDMLVRNVWNGRVEKTVQSAVHLPRLIGNAMIQMGLKKGQGVPVSGDHVLNTIDRLLKQTRPENRLWGALLRYHLNPRDLVEMGFTTPAFDWLAEQILVKHMKSWVAPGEMAGIIAAQSLGEPTTQMTLNSVDWETEIMIAKDGRIQTPRIGEFIDEYIKACETSEPARIQYLANDQVYVSLEGDGHDWQAVSCDENGVMQWTKLEAITRHPVVNEDGSDTILEVTTESGRTVKATKGRSFLTFANGKIADMLGANLKIGDELPVANNLAIQELPIIKQVHVAGFPDTFVLDREFGFFCGAYVSEGSCSSTQINITNNDDVFLAPLRMLLDKWNVGHHTVTASRDIQKTGKTTSLIIHSTLLTAYMKHEFGARSYEKQLPSWIFQAPDEFIKGLIDGYFSGDGSISKAKTVNASSASDPLITRLITLLARFGIFARKSSSMPDIRKFASVRRQYSLYIPQKYARVFANTFTLTIERKQKRLNNIKNRVSDIQCRKTEFADMILDRVKSICEVAPRGGKVYDITVEKTRNFMTSAGLAQKDTFHTSGVAKPGTTQGVPRLKELLKVTQNPKATSLTVYLRRDLRTSKEAARRLAQEMEFTVLRDLVTVARIYYDPRETSTLIADDQDWLSFYAAFEQQQETDKEKEKEKEKDKSPWIIHLELDREKLFAKNITMDDISFILRKANTSNPIEITYTDHNSTQMVFRIRILYYAANKGRLDDLTIVKQIQNNLLTQTLVRGLPGLKSVTFRQIKNEVFEKNPDKDNVYESADQFVLYTLGTNFLDVMIHPDVDGSKLTSNHVHDILENLGIEAARQTLFREIFTLFEQQAPVNYRHVALLCDAMCNRGRMMSADRYGVNKKKGGSFAKASFEQAEDIMLRAAMFGEMEPVTGVSANIMTGQSIRGGTSFGQILLDEEALVDLIQTTPAQEQDGHAVNRLQMAPVLDDQQIDALLDADDTMTGCGKADLRIQAALPPVDKVIASASASADLPDLDIQIV